MITIKLLSSYSALPKYRDEATAPHATTRSLFARSSTSASMASKHVGEFLAMSQESRVNAMTTSLFLHKSV